MANWLLKSEPTCYSWDDLARDKKTAWDGIANAAALIHLRAMKKGDLALIYHTGNQRAAVGIAQVTKSAYPDPRANNPRLVAVDLKPMTRLLHPVTLAQIKADKAFAGWDLLRISRLSVMPVPQRMWDHLMKLSDAPDH